MRKSRYDEAEGGEIKRWRLVNTFSATESKNLSKTFCIVVLEAFLLIRKKRGSDHNFERTKTKTEGNS